MGVKISALPEIITPSLADVFPVVQSGVTYKESFTQLTSLFATAGANSNITSMTGLTGALKAPTGILDASGNEVVSFSSTANAVNWIDILNESTGELPAFRAGGADADVGMAFLTKADGVFAFVAPGNVAPFIISSGTSALHVTHIIFADTSVTREVTFPDLTGTVYLYAKVNGAEAGNATTASGTTGVITTSALTTAGGASYAITWTNTFITTDSTILLSLMGGTNTTENITLKATAGAGSSTLTIYNNTAATSLNGTILIGYIVIP